MAERFLPLFCLAIYAAAVTVGAFTGGIWAAFGIALALILYFSLSIARKEFLPLPHDLAYLTLAVIVIFAAELPLSLHPEISTKAWLSLFSVFVPLLLFSSPALSKTAFSLAFIPVVSLAALVGCVALGIELQSGGFLLHAFKKTTAPLTEYNRGIAHLAILAFPLCAGLWAAGGKKAAPMLAALFLFPASLTESHTAQLALITGAFCAAAAFYRPLWLRNILAAALLAVIGWPFYAQAVYAKYHVAVENWHSSWRHRMEIWDCLSYRIAERPFFGWGLNTSHKLDCAAPHGDWYQVLPAYGIPHAHNFITELWAETGLVGLVCGIAFMLLMLRRAYALHASLRPFALGGWAASVIVAMFGFDFWTDALWAAFALSAFAFAMLQQRIESGHRGLDA